MSPLTLMDTTIRDGELSPSFNPTPNERLYIAESLESAGIDVIELASTAYDDDRLKSCRDVAKSLNHSTVCCLSQLNEHDIEKAQRLFDGVPHTRLHLYLDAKRVHRFENKGNDKEDILELISSIVDASKRYFEEIEFSPQDATRVRRETLSEIVSAAIDAGADIINISDTTGTATPKTIQTLFDGLSELVPKLTAITLSMHAHNNLDRATENTLAAIKCGVTQVEGTINGVGPAGGNTNLIDVIDLIQQTEISTRACTKVDLNRLRALGEKPIFD